MADGFQGLVLIDTSKRRAGHIGKGGGEEMRLSPSPDTRHTSTHSHYCNAHTRLIILPVCVCAVT